MKCGIRTLIIYEKDITKYINDKKDKPYILFICGYEIEFENNLWKKVNNHLKKCKGVE